MAKPGTKVAYDTIGGAEVTYIFKLSTSQYGRRDVGDWTCSGCHTSATAQTTAKANDHAGWCRAKPAKQED